MTIRFGFPWQPPAKSTTPQNFRALLRDSLEKRLRRGFSPHPSQPLTSFPPRPLTSFPPQPSTFYPRRRRRRPRYLRRAATASFRGSLPVALGNSPRSSRRSRCGRICAGRPGFPGGPGPDRPANLGVTEDVQLEAVT